MMTSPDPFESQPNPSGSRYPNLPPIPLPPPSETMGDVPVSRVDHDDRQYNPASPVGEDSTSLGEPGASIHTDPSPTSELPLTNPDQERATPAEIEQKRLRAEQLGKTIEALEHRQDFRRYLGQTANFGINRRRREDGSKRLRRGQLPPVTGLPQRVAPADRKERNHEKRVAERVSNSALRSERDRSKNAIHGSHRGRATILRTHKAKKVLKSGINQLHVDNQITGQQLVNEVKSLANTIVYKERLGARLSRIRDTASANRAIRSALQPIRARRDGKKLARSKAELQHINDRISQSGDHHGSIDPTIYTPNTDPITIPRSIEDTGSPMSTPDNNPTEGGGLNPDKHFANPSKVLEIKERINDDLARYLLSHSVDESDNTLMAKLKSFATNYELGAYFDIDPRELDNPAQTKVSPDIIARVRTMLDMPTKELEDLVASQ
ncbi:MAG TPA: hypothetical protein VMR18_03975 [Candidatus Saccharimonadales bacterium]|nr:hypothetical protein [Candidatus Saccharimonadales bacterium]